MMDNLTTLRDTYHLLEADRTEYINRGVRSSVLTIPSVFPKEGTKRDCLPQSFQSIGSRGVNNITAKLLLTLFPPTLPFMRLEMSPLDMAQLESQARQTEGAENSPAEIRASLQMIEQQAVSNFNKDGWRPAVAEAMRLAVVTGNALIYDRPGGVRPSTYDLHNYVVERDPEGTLVKVILCQKLTRESAYAQLQGVMTPEEIEMIPQETSSAASSEARNTFELFTGAIRNAQGSFDWWQEINGMMVGGVTKLQEKALPLMPLRFQPIYGASYGRGYVEEYDGDLLTLEQISRALAENSLALSKIIWLIRPGATTKAAVLAKAPNGSIRQGDADDVGALRADKGQDMAIAMQQKRDLVVQLSMVFLLNSSVQRNGDRVTAEEIRYVAQELEDALGGVYSSLADTMQLPVVEYLFMKLKRDGQINLPKEVKPIIATGLEAISRNHRALRIQQSLGALNDLIGPQNADQILNRSAIARDMFTANNLEADQYLLSDEEVAERQAQAQQQAAVEALGPTAITAMSNAAPPQAP